MSYERIEIAFLVNSLLFLVGLYYSQALLSITPYVFLVLGLVNLASKKPSLDKKQLRPYLAIASIFILYVLSGFISENKTVWMSRLNSNLIYFILPLSFVLLRPIRRTMTYRILELFFLISIVASSIVLLNYLANFAATNESYLHGKTMVTPILHVRFSMFVTGAVLCGLFLLLENKPQQKLTRTWLIIGLVFLILFSHLLAVRTGLLTLYCLIAFTALYHIRRSSRIKESVIGLGILALFPIISYFIFPSFQNKVAYVAKDWGIFFQGGHTEHFSDNIRMRSIQNGLSIFKTEPIFGCGIGDLNEEMSTLYAERFPKMPKHEQFMPINQYIFILSSFGTLGFLWFFSAFFYPIFYFRKRLNYFIIGLFLIMAVAFIGENAVELQLGKSFFLFFVMMSIGFVEEEINT